MPHHLLIAFVFCSFFLSAQAQPKWHLKLGIGSGATIDYWDWDWQSIKERDVVREVKRFRIRPSVGMMWNKVLTKNASFEGDFNLMWHSFDFEGQYGGLGGGYNLRGKFNLFSIQSSGRFTFRAYEYLHLKLGLGSVFRLFDSSTAMQSGYGQSLGRPETIEARDIFRRFLLFPSTGFAYQGYRMGMEMTAGHSLARFPFSATHGNTQGYLISWQIAVIFKV